MVAWIDITGQRFGRWSVIKYIGGKMWRCKCDCGVMRSVTGKYLRNGRSKSCGCQQGAVMRKNFFKHGHGYSDPTYRSWHGMLARCYIKRSVNYKWYGKRGIKVCARWRSKNGFINFLADMGPRPPDKPTIERKNPSGNYTPRNCYWATWSEQRQNRRPSS